MAKEYKLLSGENIDLSELSEDQQKHVSQIEELIARSENYFEVDRQAFGPVRGSMEGRIFTPKQLRELYDSPHYLIVSDLINRYYHQLKLFLPPKDR